MRLNSTLLKATGVGALGGLLFGFDTAVIAGTTHSLTLTYGLSPRQLGLTVAMALIGTIIGAMSAGIPGQRWGGRETLRMLAIFYVLSALGCAFALELALLLVLPPHRRTGHRRVLGAGPGVHCRTCPGKIARPACGIVSVQRGIRHFAGLYFQLHDPHHGPWRPRMALAVRRCRLPASAFPGHALRHSAQPALAGHARTASRRRSPC